MKTRFTTLYISNSLQSDLCANDMDIARRFVLCGGGQNLRIIIVGFDIYPGAFEAVRDSGPNIVDDFLKSCPNVISLSIHEPIGEWVSKFGDQLEDLTIQTKKANTLECLWFDSGWNEFPDEDYNIEWAMEDIKQDCRNLRRINFYDIKQYGMKNYTV